MDYLQERQPALDYSSLHLPSQDPKPGSSACGRGKRRFGPDSRRIYDSTTRNMLNAALAGTGLTDHAGGSPLHYSPPDFR